jgi:hypothetical protein
MGRNETAGNSPSSRLVRHCQPYAFPWPNFRDSWFRSQIRLSIRGASTGNKCICGKQTQCLAEFTFRVSLEFFPSYGKWFEKICNDDSCSPLRRHVQDKEIRHMGKVVDLSVKSHDDTYLSGDFRELFNAS